MRLIDATEAATWARIHIQDANERCAILDFLRDCATIDPASLRPKGEWLFQIRYYEVDECACSACGQLLTTRARERTNYCPNCGADMRRAEE